MKGQLRNSMSFAFVFVLTNSILWAQSVSIETVNVPVEVYRIPEHPLDTSIKTYSVSFAIPGTDLVNTGISTKELLDKYAILDGYKKVGAVGDAHVNITAGNILVTGEKMDSRKTQTIDKEGNALTKHEFFMTFQYAVPLSYKITDRSGKVLYEKSIADMNDRQSYKTDIYAKDIDLDAYWRMNKSNKLAELQKKMINDHMDKLRDELSRNHGYSIQKQNAEFETIGKKKHPEFEKFNSKLEAIKSVFAGLNAQSNIRDAETRLKDVIDFYVQSADSYSASDKEALRLKQMSLYNLATLYYWLDNFHQASTYVQQLIALDADHKEAQKLSEKIKSTQQNLFEAGQTCRRKTAS